MERRLLSLLSNYSVSAACCLAITSVGHAQEPKTLAPSAVPLVVVAPSNAGTPILQSAPSQVSALITFDAPPSAPVEAARNNYDICAQSCRVPPASRFFFTADYLMWWFKDSPQPVPLVTATPAELVDGVKVGSLSDPNASIILGGSDLDTGMRTGYRLTAGMWMDDHHCLGFETSYFFFTPSTITQGVGAAGANNTLLLSVPFYDVTGLTRPDGLPGESARPISTPGLFTFDYPSTAPGQSSGIFIQRLESQLQGFELNTLIGLSSKSCNDGFRLHAIAGFRYLSFRENYEFGTALSAEPLGFSDMLFGTWDQFSTRNDFYGGQIGVRGEYTMNRFVLQAVAKVALGDMQQQVTINGATVTNVVEGPGTPLVLYQGGVFAQPTNIGSYTRDVFAVVPQIDLNVGYKVTENVRLTMGYSLLYLSNVARPGNEINRYLNVSRIPMNNDPNGGNIPPSGSLSPSFNFDNSSFWAQGVNFGLEFKF